MKTTLVTQRTHPAYQVITGQKAWMLALFTGLVRGIAPRGAAQLGRTLMLPHEGGLVAHGLHIVPDTIDHARDDAAVLVGDALRAASSTQEKRR
ncbi:hypothetical protein ACFVXC_19190 [Streptomyces sp. NPDC058257]|uniref:hypothetical protein n=1 Tax=Streptomyces sp. NPDC058257 TaxID=3346409 RepID=UPI0036EC061D